MSLREILERKGTAVKRVGPAEALEIAARGAGETGRKVLRRFSTWEITRYLIPVAPAHFRRVPALMRLERVGALVVSEDEGQLAGIVSEKDVVRAIIDVGARALQQPVSEFMERRPSVCSPDDTVAKAANAMTLRRARHLPASSASATS